MKKMIALSGKTFRWVCVGTVITQLVLLTVLYGKGALTPTKRLRIQGVLAGMELDQLRSDRLSAIAVQHEAPDSDNPLEGFVRKRREDQVNEGIDYIESMRSGITRERERYAIIRSDFDQRLNTMETDGREASRLVLQQTLEAIKPRQAKDQLVRMINDGGLAEAAVIIQTMSDAARKKIFDEFKQPGDEQRLNDLVMAIRAQQRARPNEPPTTPPAAPGGG